MAGGVAARVAGVQRRHGGSFVGTSTAASEPDVSYPTVELYLGGTWVDITSYVYYRDMIRITRGQAAEATQVDPSSCQFTVNNRDGRFAPRNPAGAYYGLIGRNTPVRVSVTRNGIRWYRFHGEVSDWQPQSDITGNDAYVQVQAAGILRRLRQGASPLKSSLYRSLTQGSPRNDIRAYWPAEDPSTANSVASALSDGVDMTYTGAKPTFASYDGFPCSDKMLVLGATRLTGTVPTYTPSTNQIVRVLLHLPSSVASTQSLIKFNTGGTIPTWEVEINTSALIRFSVRDTSNTLVYDSGFLNFGASFGENCDLAFRMTQSGSDVVALFIVAHMDNITSYSPVVISNNSVSPTLTSENFGPISSVILGDDLGLTGTAVGHVVVNNTDLFYGELSALGPDGSAATVSALLANCGENPTARIHRLCGEEDVSFADAGDITDTVGVGFQRTNTLSDLLEETARTGIGTLYETRDQLGVGYVTRNNLYNRATALTLDYSAHALSSPLVPVDDDRLTRNDVTVTSTSNTSAHVTLDTGTLSTQAPPNGVGKYDTSVSINQVTTGFQGATVLNADATLTNIAAWRLHQGTVDEPRYPAVSINLRHPVFTESVTMMNTALATDVGSGLAVTNPPTWTPGSTVRGLVQGYNETLGVLEHDITFITAPLSAWDVAIADTDRADTSGSTLAADATDTATTLSVATTTGPLWTTSGGQFPFDVNVAGEVVTVTAISGASSPQTFTVTRSTNGVVKAQTTGADVRLAQPAIAAL